MGTPKASAIRNASSSEGECLPASTAMMVCRETPAFSASSCWVISLAKNRSLRMLFVISIFLAILDPPSIKVQLGKSFDQCQFDRFLDFFLVKIRVLNFLRDGCCDRKQNVEDDLNEDGSRNPNPDKDEHRACPILQIARSNHPCLDLSEGIDTVCG